MWTALLVWIADILVISLPLAIFEIVIERQEGWGGRLNPSGWGRKLFSETIVSEICEKCYLTIYHIFTFAFIVPSLLFMQLPIANYIGLCHLTSGYIFGRVHSGLLMQVGDIKFIPILFLVSVWFGILVVEDALWFALNWHYPGSWRDLLEGKIWWHTRWITVGNVKLPRFYVTTPIAAVVLFALSLSVR